MRALWELYGKPYGISWELCRTWHLLTGTWPRAAHPGGSRREQAEQAGAGRSRPEPGLILSYSHTLILSYSHTPMSSEQKQGRPHSLCSPYLAAVVHGGAGHELRPKDGHQRIHHAPHALKYPRGLMLIRRAGRP